MIFTLGNRSISPRNCGKPCGVICMQTGVPVSAACCQAGKVRGSSNQVAWPGMVLPVVNSRMPENPRASQCFIFSTLSAASMSTENTPVKRLGCAAIASAT